MVFVFDCRSNSDEDFELELVRVVISTHYYLLVLTFKFSMGNAYSTSFNIQVDTRIDILK